LGKVKVIVVLALLALLASTGWQIGACEIANLELQDDLKDIASLNSWRIGLAAPKSDDDLREAVISKAREHGIVLAPRQVTVRSSGSSEAPVVYLAVDYKAHIALPGYRLTIRFKPTGGIRR